MGRQICVEVKDLVRAGCTIVANYSTFTDYGYDEVAEEETPFEVKQSYITIVIPGGNAISSYCEDSLVFDCRNKESNNYWVEQWLISKNIPYTAG